MILVYKYLVNKQEGEPAHKNGIQDSDNPSTQPLCNGDGK
jgi:hypothetical protein